jgi:hypothetical protein
MPWWVSWNQIGSMDYMRKSFELFNKINNASIDLQMNFSCLHISMSTMKLIVLSVFFKHSFQTRPHLTIQMLKKFSRGCTLQTEPSLLRNRALSHHPVSQKVVYFDKGFFLCRERQFHIWTWTLEVQTAVLVSNNTFIFVLLFWEKKVTSRRNLHFVLLHA